MAESSVPHGHVFVVPALFAVLATVVQEVGAAFAVGLFDELGVAGTVFARYAVAAVVLCAVIRPRVSGLDPQLVKAVAWLAVTLTLMNLCFYESLSRIPLGIAVTIEICGPLLLSVALSRRGSAWIWALVAFMGVSILGLNGDPLRSTDLVGVVFASGAAISWAGYILASARAGRVFANLDGLALATVVGAVLTAPAAAVSIDLGSAFRWEVAGLVVLVGGMCSVIPYSLELMSLRTLSAGTFAVLTSVSPAVAAGAGWLILGQRLGLTDYLAMALVAIASAGAVRSAGTPTPSPPD